MKLSILLISMCFSNYMLKAQTPITLTNANMPGANDTLRYTNAVINSLGNYTQTGVNFQWNFSTLVSASQGVRAYKTGLQSPYPFYFLGLNEYGEKIADTLGAGPITITKYWNFYKKQTTPVNAYVADGVGMTFSSIPVPCYYSNKDELYNFPMTFPKYDSTTFKFSTPTVSLLPITYSKAGYRVTKVDGWGKVITPYDTADCLRLVTTQYAIDTIKTTIGPITIPIGFPNYQRSYQWMTLNSKIPFMEVSGSLVGNVFTVTQVRYRGYKRTANPIDPVGLISESLISDFGLYPNPVKDKLYINPVEKSAFDIVITDINGALVKRESISNSNSLQGIDVEGLKQGLYFIRISQKQTETYLKFIKE